MIKQHIEDIGLAVSRATNIPHPLPSFLFSMQDNTKNSDTPRPSLKTADGPLSARILRNPDCEDEVMLALTKDDGMIGIGHMPRHDDEYQAIGQKIYDWLCEVIIPKHEDELIITNFDIEVVATCKGRPKQ